MIIISYWSPFHSAFPSLLSPPTHWRNLSLSLLPQPPRTPQTSTVWPSPHCLCGTAPVTLTVPWRLSHEGSPFPGDPGCSLWVATDLLSGHLLVRWLSECRSCHLLFPSVGSSSSPLPRSHCWCMLLTLCWGRLALSNLLTMLQLPPSSDSNLVSPVLTYLHVKHFHVV